MKPKTIAEKEVVSLSKKTPKIKSAEKKYMESLFPYFYTFYYNKLLCLECGHTWKSDLQKWQDKVAGIQCPSCKKKLEKEASLERFTGKLMSIENSFCKTFYVGNFQVFRYIECKKVFNKKEKPSYYYRYYFEEWIPVNEVEKYKGKTFVIGKYSMSFYHHFNAGLYELRNNKKNRYNGSNDYDNFSSDFNLINPLFHPNIQNRGITFENAEDIDYRDLFKKIIEFPGYETLLKMGESSILYDSVYRKFDLKKFWKQVKFALRQQYNIDDPQIWQDYLQMAVKNGLDINHPHIALPENIREAHDQLVLQAVRTKEENSTDQDQLNRIKVRKLKKEFLGDFFFEKDEIKVVPIITPEETYDEYKKLGHCVHNNEYHNKIDSILFSVSVNDENVETAEYSISRDRVIQCRGVGNKPSNYHHEILDVFDEVIPKLKPQLKKLIPEIKQIINV